MISRKTLYIMCAVVNISCATQTIHAGLWQTLCSPFARSVEYIKQRPLVALAGVVSIAAVFAGLYWWKKSVSGSAKPHNVASAVPKNENQQKVELAPQSLADDAQRAKKKNYLSQAIEIRQRALAHFRNAKTLINNHDNQEGNLFYAQLREHLQSIGQSFADMPCEWSSSKLQELQALGFDRYAQGSKEYWDACAKLYFYLDEYSKFIQEKLSELKKACAELGK